MKASVIVPTYNQVNLLKNCLKSFENQSVDKGDFEVIVVNDASQDDTSLFLERYRPGYNLSVVNHPRNLGRAQARNSGAKQAEGELLIFLDGDSTVDFNFVSEHLKGCEGGKDSVCIGNVRLSAECEVLPFKSYLTTRGVQRLKSGEEVPFRYFVSGNISLPRGLFERTGGFDPSFLFYGGEDLDLGIRLHQAGAKFIFLPGAISYHHLEDDLKGAIDKKYIFGNRALPSVIEKHPEVVKELPVVKLSRNLIFRLLLADIFYRSILGVAMALKRKRFPSFLFDYLFHGATVKGLKDHEEDQREAVSPEVRGSKVLLAVFILWVLFANLYYYLNFALTRFERLELLPRLFLSIFK
jgi:glycosyltransferase involved in cell wall biosynthesis